MFLVIIFFTILLLIGLMRLVILVFVVSTLRRLSVFFLTVLVYSAPGQICSLLRAARVFADRWTTMHVLITNNISAFLFGTPFLLLEQNNDLFFHVQSFLSESMRFQRNV